MLFNFINFSWARDANSLRSWETDLFMPTFLQTVPDGLPLEDVLRHLASERQDNFDSYALGGSLKAMEGMHRQGRIVIDVLPASGAIMVKAADGKNVNWKLEDMRNCNMSRDSLYSKSTTFRMDISGKVWDWLSFEGHSRDNFLCFPLYVLLRYMAAQGDEQDGFTFDASLAAHCCRDLIFIDVMSALTNLKEAGIIDFVESEYSNCTFNISSVEE